MNPLYGKIHRRLHKLRFYLRHAPLEFLPQYFLQKDYNTVISEFKLLSAERQQNILNRVNYYNQLSEPQNSQATKRQIQQFTLCKPSAYYYDLIRLLRYFPPNYYFAHQFGDVTKVPEQPTFVKSRPINSQNTNSVLLKLNSLRHFYLYPDKHSFRKKKQQLVWRGAAYHRHRINFLEQFYDNELVNVGSINQELVNKPYHGGYLSIAEQLKYRYILSIEGNDVATNLKWILASNSLCFMVTPKYETWLMEGCLKPHTHYVRLEDDYSDLEEKITFYNQHPKAAEKIIQNAQFYMQPFLDKKQELIISLLVMKKYFEMQK